ncbi:hypothetical protein, partial [Nocardioides sp.]|uniref:hypothetical protein n=1 Tax=Nocardioides sp. TaxID=35761 RepID=UPI002733241B
WLGFPASLYLRAAPDQAPVTLELRTGEDSVTILAADGSVRVQQGATPEPDLVLSGTPQLLLGAISDLLPLEDARALGLVIDGDPDVLVRLQ